MKKPVKDVSSLMNKLAIVIAGLAIILLGWFLLPQDDEGSIAERVERTEKPDPRCDFRRALDGVCVEKESDMQVPLVAVMVENHFEADPVAGLHEASVVFEAPVEGRIPRFMAIFPQDADVDKVGPVRSARPYYVDWLGAYPGAMYMHVGGSPQALEQIETDGIFDMNEFYRGWYYWRAEDRRAPHNVFTSDTLWNSAIERYADADTDYRIAPWNFSVEEACTENCVERISLVYGARTYEPAWQFSSSTMQYAREQFGRAHTVESGEQIMADTVVVMVVPTTVIDNVGRLALESIGEGEAHVFQAGYHTKGSWVKEDKGDRLRFYNENQEQVALRPGNIWLQVITEDMATRGFDME